MLYFKRYFWVVQCKFFYFLIIGLYNKHARILKGFRSARWFTLYMIFLSMHSWIFSLISIPQLRRTWSMRTEQAMVVVEASALLLWDLKGEGDCEGQQPFSLQLEDHRSAGQRKVPSLIKLCRKRYLFLLS